MSFMTPILMVPSVYCACAPGHPRATASAMRLISRPIGFSRCEGSVFGLVQTPRHSRDVRRPEHVCQKFDSALALKRRSAIRLELCSSTQLRIMRLSRLARTAVSAGEMKAQLERQPEILR